VIRKIKDRRRTREARKKDSQGEINKNSILESRST